MSSTLTFKQPTELTDLNAMKKGLESCNMKYTEIENGLTIQSQKGGDYNKNIATLKTNPATGKIEIACDIHYNVTTILIADKVIELKTNSEEDKISIINALSAVYAIGEAVILLERTSGISSNGTAIQEGGDPILDLPMV